MRERKRGREKRQRIREREIAGERESYVNSWEETRMHIRLLTMVPTEKGK